MNDKGYLIDKNGNVIDCKGTVVWKEKDLKNGEFMKIFPFTKFDKLSVKGDFETDSSVPP